MEYERDYTFANMYLGNEIRFSEIANGFKSLFAKLSNRPNARKPIAA